MPPPPPPPHSNYSVTPAPTVAAALELLHQAHQSGNAFDLILTDLVLPELSGFHLIQEVVTGAGGSGSVPIVVMSSEDKRESVMQVCVCVCVCV